MLLLQVSFIRQQVDLSALSVPLLFPQAGMSFLTVVESKSVPQQSGST